jgi:CcmD family protein
MTGLQYLALAYALIWTALAAYLFRLGRRIGRLTQEVKELERRTGGNRESGASRF